MKNLHINILKCLDRIINETADHIHDFINSPSAFTRKRKLDAFTSSGIVSFLWYLLLT